jgi:1-acyl-sn-glycerol-3-phosphate acyltransferase
MMRTLRLWIRCALLVVCTFAVYGVWMLVHPLALLCRRSEPWRRFTFRYWGRSCCAVLGVRVEQAGSAPRPPFLLVSNHLSYVDVFVYARQTGAVFLSKAEIADWPLLGCMSRNMGTLFVDRSRRTDVSRVIALIEERLARRQGIVLFPEGTSTVGDSVLPFRTSLLEPAARARLPVFHATIHYSTSAGDPPAKDAVCWGGEEDFLAHFLRFSRLSGVRARVVFGAEAVLDDNRKSLAGKLHEQVRAHFVPII